MRLPFAKRVQDAPGEEGRPNAASSGKRRSVNGPKGLLAAPAQIMGPRLLFILAVVLLSVTGVVMVYSASSIFALTDADSNFDPTYYLKRQLLFLVIGAVACVVCAAIPYRFWSRKPVFMLLWLLAVGLLALTALGFGTEEYGASRALRFGPFRLQPAEFAKIAVVLTCAALVEVQRQERWPLPRWVIVLALTALIPLVLIYRQPDLGTAIILAVGLLALMWLVGVPWVVIVLFIGLFAAYVAFACITQPYHLDRIITMFDPWLDPTGKGYQSIQSLYAFGSGGIFGTGLGLSRQKYLYLPFAHTDFIFAVIGEELGLFGSLGVMALFGVFVFAGMRICRSAPDIFGASVAGAMTVMVGFQACVNMMCVSGIAPVTGKALPFVSYGGSSLLATMITVGIILSVSLRSKVGVTAELRRDNLFVIDGGSARGEKRGSRAAAAQGAVQGAAGQGLRVVEGFKGRFSREEREQEVTVSSRARRTSGAHDGATARGERFADPSATGRLGSASRMCSTSRTRTAHGASSASRAARGSAAGSRASGTRATGTGTAGTQVAGSSARNGRTAGPGTGSHSAGTWRETARIDGRERNTRRGDASRNTRSGYGADLRVKDDASRNKRR